MADAKKCDICGRYYDTYTTKNLVGEMVNGFKFGNEGYTNKHSWLDCCTECLTSIENHIKGLMPKAEEPEVNPCRCDTCLWQDTGSENCKACITDNRPETRLTSIPSHWEPKGDIIDGTEELVATHIWSDDIAMSYRARLADGRVIDVIQVVYANSRKYDYEETDTGRRITLSPDCMFGEGITRYV